MTEVKIKKLNANQARALTNRIQSTWRNLEALLVEAIKGNVWGPLGYDSFTAWFDAEMSGIPLAMGARNLVVITLFAEQTETKITQADIADMVGVSPSTITQIRKSWNAGLLPFLPPLKLRPSDDRAKPQRRVWSNNFRWMGIRTRVELHQELKSYARENRTTLTNIHEEALELYADLKIRHGVEPTQEERAPKKG